MKPLKISTIIILVLALVFSLPTTNAVAGKYYRDESSISYPEAVETLTVLGILDGRATASGEQGSFEPRGTITRAEAAKLCFYLALGAESARSVEMPDETGFADVPITHWAALYIAYCAREGIIHGSESSNSSAKYFAPEQPVTGYEMLKLLLGALGYGTNNEFVGENWTIRVANFARLNQLTANVIPASGASSMQYDSPACREEAILYTFNALKRDIVRRHPRSGQYEPISDPKITLLEHVGGDILSGTIAYDNGFIVSGYPLNSDAAKSSIPLAQQLDYTDLGRLAHVYCVFDAQGNITASTDAYFDDTVIGVRTDVLSLKIERTDADGFSCAGFPSVGGLLLSLNGINLPAGQPVEHESIFVRGNQVYFIDTTGDGLVDTAKIFLPSAGLVTRPPTESDNGLLRLDGFFQPSGTRHADKVFGWTELKTGDVILITELSVCGDILTFIEKADVITRPKVDTQLDQTHPFIVLGGEELLNSGLQSASRNPNNIPNRIGGSELPNNLPDGADVAVYLDKGGNVLHVAPLEGAVAGQAFVLDAYVGDNGVSRAELLLTDGNVIVVGTKENYGFDGTDLRNKFVSVSDNGSGIIILTPYGETNGAYSDGPLFAESIPGMGDTISVHKIDTGMDFANPAVFNVDESTLFIINEFGHFRVYEGLSDAPEFSAVRAELYYCKPLSSYYAKYVYITNGQHRSQPAEYLLFKDVASYSTLADGSFVYDVHSISGSDALTAHPDNTIVYNDARHPSDINALESTLYLSRFDGEKLILTRFDNVATLDNHDLPSLYYGTILGIGSSTITLSTQDALALSPSAAVYFVSRADNDAVSVEARTLADISDSDDNAEYAVVIDAAGEAQMILHFVAAVPETAESVVRATQ